METIYKYTGDGITKNYSYPSFDNEISNIGVEVNGISVDFEIDTFLGEVVLDTAPLQNDEIKVFRYTSYTRLVDYQNGSLLSEKELDKDSDQLMALINENNSETIWKIEKNTEENNIYNDEQNQIILQAAKDYVDNKFDNQTQVVTQEYIDQNDDNNTLSSANTYTDNEITNLTQYVNRHDQIILQAAKDYFDIELIDSISVVTQNYVDQGDEYSIIVANEYTDDTVSLLLANDVYTQIQLNDFFNVTGIGITGSNINDYLAPYLQTNDVYTQIQLNDFFNVTEIGITGSNINDYLAPYLQANDLENELNKTFPFGKFKFGINGDGGLQGYITTTSYDIIASDMSLEPFPATNNINILLDGNVVWDLGYFPASQKGKSGIISFTQDVLGNRSISFGTRFKFENGVAPTFSTEPGTVDILVYYVLDENNYICNFINDVK